jgi:hypothetical protein
MKQNLGWVTAALLSHPLACASATLTQCPANAQPYMFYFISPEAYLLTELQK